MHTASDLASVAIFAVLAITYLQRSASESADDTPLWIYAALALACAAGNYLGNHARPRVAAFVLGVAALGVALVLRHGARRDSR